MADLIAQIFEEILPPADRHLLPVLKGIVEKNRQLGRFPARTNEDNPVGLKGYCEDVYHNYRANHPTLMKLQVDKDEAEWTALLPRLYRWATRTLRFKASHLHYISIEEWGREISHLACHKILQARYNYDVPLNAWLFTILRNVAYNEIRYRLTNQQQHEDAVRQVDDFNEITHLLTAPFRVENRDPLLPESEVSLQSLVEQLPPVQQQVIRLHYFEERSLSEISGLMGKTTNAIYQAHFAGLRKLRVLLDELRNQEQSH